jgi:hypothetical protein
MLATQKRQISSKKLHIHTVSFQTLRNGGNMILLVLRCGSLIESTRLLLSRFFLSMHILSSPLMVLHSVTFSHIMSSERNLLDIVTLIWHCKC